MDYKNIKLKCGIEIHQQLDTHKLFCPCPSILKQSEPDLRIKRKFKAVSGESGMIDEAASFEQARDKEFIYEFYKESNCLVELDEEPPHEINQDALKIVLQIAMLLNMKIFPIIQVMRKTVIDGSNTSGFQRTALIANNGFIEIELEKEKDMKEAEKKKIGIQSLCLEEDAARIIKQDEKETIFRLDRLGIPLVEIATYPDISTPEEAKLVALKLGEILRACKVKRGIGTIRQDVNMSINKTNWVRFEIKGVQEPWLIEQTIYHEISRQLQLIKENKKLMPEVRKANEKGTTSFLRPLPGSSRMYPETDLPLIRITNEILKEIRKELPILKKELELELKEKGLNQELAKLILQENKLQEFKALIAFADKPNLAAKLLVLLPKEIASHEKISIEKVNERLTYDIIETIFQAIANSKIPETSAKQIMFGVVNGRDINKILNEVSSKVQFADIEKEIQKIIKSKPNLSLNAYMGLVMPKFKQVDAKQVSDILKKYIK